VGHAVLHHLRLDRALPELLRVLRPGGRLCFAEPNMLNPQVFLERNVPFIGRWLENSPGETAFTRWGLRRTLARLGLVDIAIRPFDFLYPLTPERLVPAMERLGRVLERTPLVAEIAGSLLISARRV
jgi:SAM-dependent methyltransferase